MLKTLYKFCTGLIIALGLLHVSFTPFNYDEFSLDAMWFLSAGVAIILAGFLNITIIRGAGRDRLVRLLCHLTNASFALLFGVALLKLPEPQVYVGLFLMICETVLAIALADKAGSDAVEDLS